MPERLINRRQQGDLGEASAIDWFTRLGAVVFVPFGHSPDIDLVVLLDDRLLKVQVKTSTQTSRTPAGHPRCSVSLATSGGNQSWSRTIKRMDPTLIDYVFVLTGDGRRWCIPAAALEAGNAVSLGGAKYSEFEIEPTGPIRPLVFDEAGLDSTAALGEYPSGQRTAAVNRQALPSEVRLLSPPSVFRKNSTFEPTRFARKPGQRGETRINYKRKVTIPQGPVLEAGLQIGDRLRARSGGYGRVILERIEPLTTPAEPEPEAAA